MESRVVANCHLNKIYGFLDFYLKGRIAEREGKRAREREHENERERASELKRE